MEQVQIASGDTADTEKQVPLPLRSDTLLGVCEALGEDLGFNPLWLRIALSSGVLWNPVAIVGIYLGLGLLVLISRMLFPSAVEHVAEERTAPAEKPVEPMITHEPERIAA